MQKRHSPVSNQGRSQDFGERGAIIIDSVERDWKRDHVGLSSVCNKRKGQRAVQASINPATSAKLRTFRDTKDRQGFLLFLDKGNTFNSTKTSSSIY